MVVTNKHLLTYTQDQLNWAEDSTPFIVMGADGKTRTLTEDKPSAVYTKAMKCDVLYRNEGSELRLVGDEENRCLAELKWNKCRIPTVPDVYEFELPPCKGMKPYITGMMVERDVYRKPENLIRDELSAKKGVEPTAAAMRQAVEQAHKYINRSVKGRKYEHSMAQSFYNNGLTAFIGKETWAKDRTSTYEQTDLYVSGIPVELKCFYKMSDYSHTDDDGELWLFVCNEHSHSRKPEGLRYYLLGYQDGASRMHLSQQYRLGWVGLHEPVAVPVGRVKLQMMKWETLYGEVEDGMFVKATDLITFNSFVRELRQHHNQMKKQSRKLDTHEVVRLFYPHLKTLDELMALHPTLTEEQVKQLYAGQDDGSELVWRVAREQERLEAEKQRKLADKQRMFDELAI